MPDGFTPAEQMKKYGAPAEREFRGAVSDQWSLKTVWGVGYKFEVVNS